MESSLYLHVPFCAACCDYCDFYSIPVSPDDKRLSGFVDNLLAVAREEIRRFGVEKIPTAYIGGGTPSILGVAGISRLLGGLRSLWDEEPEEITLEANPESVDEGLLRAARAGGVTRLSLGVQSLSEASRRAVNRAGDSKLLPEKLRLVKDFFPGGFSADLMAGLPFQDEGALLADIDRLLAYEPAHVSLYALTVEKGTPLAENARNRRFLPSAEEADRIWLAGRDALEQAGYRQYEVSNFARPGKESLHNIRYWRMENWLGIGPAASGTIIDDGRGVGRRLTWPAQAEDWLSPLEGDNRAMTGSPMGWPLEERLDRIILMKESLLMGFRYVEGPDGELFKRRFGLSINDAIPRTVAAWRGRGFFAGNTIGEERRPSKEGLLFLDPFLRDAFAELEKNLV